MVALYFSSRELGTVLPAVCITYCLIMLKLHDVVHTLNPLHVLVEVHVCEKGNGNKRQRCEWHYTKSFSE